MSLKIIDEKLLQLKELEEKIQELTYSKDTLREEVLGLIEKDNMEQYKNSFTTVSYIERKTVKIKDEESLIKKLESQRVVKYYTIIPEHTELNEKFLQAVKAGNFKDELVELQTTKSLAIRFHKEEKKK